MSDDYSIYSEEQFKAQLKKLGLTPSTFSHSGHTIYITADGDTISVLDANRQTPAQRYETIQKVKDRLGISV
jgi:hypothetical protein